MVIYPDMKERCRSVRNQTIPYTKVDRLHTLLTYRLVQLFNWQIGRVIMPVLTHISRQQYQIVRKEILEHWPEVLTIMSDVYMVFLLPSYTLLQLQVAEYKEEAGKLSWGMKAMISWKYFTLILNLITSLIFVLKVLQFIAQFLRGVWG